MFRCKIFWCKEYKSGKMVLKSMFPNAPYHNWALEYKFGKQNFAKDPSKLFVYANLRAALQQLPPICYYPYTKNICGPQYEIWMVKTGPVQDLGFSCLPTLNSMKLCYTEVDDQIVNFWNMLSCIEFQDNLQLLDAPLPAVPRLVMESPYTQVTDWVIPIKRIYRRFSVKL